MTEESRVNGFEVKFDFKAVAKEQSSRVARRFTSRKATEAKARLPQVHEDLTFSRSGHQVQASSSGGEKFSKDKLKYLRLHLPSRIEQIYKIRLMRWHFMCMQSNHAKCPIFSLVEKLL